MFCKYCGKIIDSDSLFCKHCGRDITGETLSIMPPSKNFNITNITQELNIWKNIVLPILKKIPIFIGKILLTIFIIIVGFMAYLAAGFILAPLIALFNAEIPELGIFSQIEEIWKNKEKPQEQALDEDTTVRPKETSPLDDDLPS